MNLIYQYVCDTEEILDSDVVIILNDDLTFHSRFFEEMEQVQLGQVFLPTVIEDGVLIDGGLHVDWKHKKFTVSDPIDCFSPRGISMRVKDFRSSCGFDADLPHKLSDLEWSMRLINSGIKPIRRGIVETYRGKEPFRLSVLSGKNPWYNSKLYFRHPYRWRNIVKEWIGLFLP